MSWLIGKRVRYRIYPECDSGYAGNIGIVVDLGMNEKGDFYALVLFDDNNFLSICSDYLELSACESRRGDEP